MSLTAEEVEEFYEGFSNGTLWPLYHDVVAKPEFHREWWDSYVTVNQRFAEKAAEVAAEGATVWVHDYQLQLVPQMLRELRPDLRIGFYLHIPFPPPELFQQLPWRRQILEGLLGADLVGFQLPGGAANFVRLVRQRVGHKTHRDLIYLPDGRHRAGRGVPDLDRHRRLRGARPLRGRQRARGRDPRGARQPAQDLPRRRPARLHQGHPRPAARVRRADRRTATSTSRTPSSCRSRRPSRERVEQYRILRDDIDRLVGRINGDLGRIGRPAISYMHSLLPARGDGRALPRRGHHGRHARSATA